jgi:hypothetical protein
MEPTRTDRDLGCDTLTAYDFAMEEVGVASSKLARALLARALNKGDLVAVERVCTEARLVYEKMIDLYPRVRLDVTQRASFLKELGVLRARLEECDAGRKTR